MFCGLGSCVVEDSASGAKSDGAVDGGVRVEEVFASDFNIAALNESCDSPDRRSRIS